MTDFILLLIVGACWTWGFHCLFSEGYLFAGLGNMIRTYTHKWVSKPLFDCPPCMASIHGYIIAAAYFKFNIFQLCAAVPADVYRVMTFMVCLCGLNFIIKSILYPEYEDVSPD